METYQCWLNDSEQILSFKPVTDYEYHEFHSSEEYWKFIFDKIDTLRYRVQ